MPDIKNIIFDLGGVLLNIDYNKTISAFKELGIENFEDMFTQFKVNELFAQFEKGRISDEEFYMAIKGVIPHPVSNDEIDKAWNAMILSFRTETLVVLEELSLSHSLYLLSNTNSIHLRYFREVFIRDTGRPLLDSYFSKCWYSHLIGLRKPDADVYKFVLEDGNLPAGQTLFVDDTVDNIETAAGLGIKTHLLLPRERIENLLF